MDLRSSMDLPSSRLCFLEIDFRWERRTTMVNQLLLYLIHLCEDSYIKF